MLNLQYDVRYVLAQRSKRDGPVATWIKDDTLSFVPYPGLKIELRGRQMWLVEAVEWKSEPERFHVQFKSWHPPCFLGLDSDGWQLLQMDDHTLLYDSVMSGRQKDDELSKAWSDLIALYQRNTQPMAQPPVKIGCKPTIEERE